jgi:hypothetical protein
LEKLSTSEIEVFKAVVLWAEEQCKKQNITCEGENKRNILGDMFYKLRIPTMTLRQYSNTVVTSDLLTEQEQLQYLIAASEPDLFIFSWSSSLFNLSIV